jgi:hypothetical protein
MADENPYESPRTPPGKPSRGNMVALVLLILLSIPAAGIAFFGVCLGTLAIVGLDQSGEIPLVTGGIAAVAVFGGGIYLANRVYQRSKRRPG